jgi:hypothetical protein
MNLLKKGSTGPEVTRWQQFLRGWNDDSDIIANGIFDDKTVAETKKFQERHMLTADGIVGPATIKESLQRKYAIDDAINGPINPGIKNLSFIDRQKSFGYFSYIHMPVPGNPEAIKITNSWAVDNIKTILVPQLVGVPGALQTGTIQVHTKIANQTLSLFQAWEDAGLKDRILTWGGSWVPRFIRGSRSSLSNHAWGTAFDINAQWNGLGMKPAELHEKGCVKELVSIAADHGFYWGGWFANRPDGMHFEAYKII